MTMPALVHAVKAMLADGEELALIDVREELIFSQNHLLWARSVPLSRLELRFRAARAAHGRRASCCATTATGWWSVRPKVLAAAGYTNLSYLEGGVAGWEKAGFELFSGVNVPSKAFGEFIEHACDTPNIGADELHRLISDGADIVVLDCRPVRRIPPRLDPDRDQRARAPSWCCACATWRPRPTRWWW